MDKSLKNKRILLTGGYGFLGSYVAEELKRAGATKISIPKFPETDLRNLSECKSAVRGKDIIIHLAGKVGGIGLNREKPGELFYDNAIMGIQLIEEARKAKVKKCIIAGTICAYPKHTPVPFKEENLWNGYPEETNAPYGLAKKMLLVQLQAYRAQYGFNGIYLLPVNLYGPRDNFDPGSSHVIPALIKKVYDAQSKGEKEITVWGTGSASREFLFVRDAARGIVMATKHYNGNEPVNLGAGFEIKIKSLVELICKIMDFEGKIIWDKTKPDGQPRRMLDTSKAQKYFGFRSKTRFEEGLEETIAWYKAFREKKK